MTRSRAGLVVAALVAVVATTPVLAASPATDAGSFTKHTFTSANGNVAVANERCAVSARLKGVRSVSMIGRGVATSE